VTPVFVDTAAWIALVNANDGLHTAALQEMASLRSRKAPLLTTEFVLLEVADALAAPLLRNRTVSFLEALRRLSVLQILPVSSMLFADGWALYRQRPDKEWGLTDCISIAVMNQAGIFEAFTSDHHFEQAGFVKLL